MNNYLSLVKVFIRSLSMNKASSKQQKIVTRVLLALVCLFILLPFVLVCGVFVFSVTKVLVEYDYQNIGLEFMCILISIFTFIFSFSVILNEFYFTSDIENLLPLPVRSSQILGAKATAVFISESLIQLLIIMFSVLGFFIALQLPFKNFLLGIIGIVTLPIIPIIYCSIISMLLMSFTRLIKNKETIRKIGLGFIIIVLLVFIYFLSFFQQFDLELYIEGFVNGDKSFLYLMRSIFPHINLFIDTLTTGSISSLLLYILINIGYILVLLGLAELCYFKGVIGLTAKDTESKRRSANILNNIKVDNPCKAYFKKEIRTLFRTTSYFLNCILINFIWPLFIYVIYKIKFSDISLSKLRNLISLYDNNTLLIIFVFVLSVSILLPAINSIAASSFSREGKQFYFMKYIPLEYNSQVFVKLFVSILITFFGINIFTLIFYFVIGLPISIIFVFLIISFLCVYFICKLGCLIDSINPKLVWDDELNALRENSNNFIVMGISMLIFIILVLGCYLLYKFEFGLAISFTFVFLFLIIINAIIYDLNRRFTVKNILKQENV